MVEDVLRRAGATVDDLGAVAVSAGPGSYTGLRIGVSTAKGLAFVSGAALVAVPSLEALAYGARDVLAEGDLLVTAFRSRRGEVYAAAFERSADGLELVAAAAALPLADLPAWLPDHGGALVLAGEAAPTVADALDGAGRRLDGVRYRPSALHVGALGQARRDGGQTEDVAAFEPDYLKAFVAKRGGDIFQRLPK